MGFSHTNQAHADCGISERIPISLVHAPSPPQKGKESRRLNHLEIEG